MKKPKVYIDTSVFKFSATKLKRLVPRRQTINWGGVLHKIDVHDLVYINPNDRIKDQNLKEEAQLLPQLAEMSKQGKMEFFVQVETIFESWGLPDMDSETGKFYGAPYTMVEAPVNYSRVLVGFNSHPKKDQFNFLAGIRHERFLELQKVTGAYQGKGELNRNQLLDAFHLWCAEYNACQYFLTLDFKLIKILRSHNEIDFKVKLVKPSELLHETDALMRA
jgi:hypothetical protein